MKTLILILLLSLSNYVHADYNGGWKYYTSQHRSCNMIINDNTIEQPSINTVTFTTKIKCDGKKLVNINEIAICNKHMLNDRYMEQGTDGADKIKYVCDKVSSHNK